jgi:hypothetical protein
MAEEPIIYEFPKLNPEHIQIIPNCGTLGHPRIIKEMFTDEAKKLGGDYKIICEKYGGEVIKLGGVVIKEPKFSMGAHLETIEAYEGPECPYECGIVTDIIQDHGNIMYEIDENVLIYEKWLRRT